MKISKEFRKICIDWHRDIGYFVSSLILMYCISGIALNHMDAFNPDFIIQTDTLMLPNLNPNLSENDIFHLTAYVGENKVKLWDKPTPNQIKIYYENASLHLYLDEKVGIYEKISIRPVVYHTNLFHRNTIRGWKWAADILAVLLIILTLTGFFIAKGKNSFMSRGIWFLVAGLVPPLFGIFYFLFFQT